MSIAEILTSGAAVIGTIIALAGIYSHFLIEKAMMKRDIKDTKEWQDNHDAKTGTLDDKLESLDDKITEGFHEVDKRLDRIERNGKPD